VLDVAVVDQKGRFVTGLERENFEVFQDGQPQPITLFRKEDSPVTVGLVVDSSTSMLPKRQETIAAALAFVEASHPQDEIFVVNFSDTAQPGLPAGLPFTSDPSVLAAALKAARPFGRTALYDALALAIRHLELGRHERKALVVFSDGGDNQSMHSLEDVMRLIQQSGVTIYAIGLYDSANRERNPQVLRRLAEESGGRAFSSRACRASDGFASGSPRRCARATCSGTCRASCVAGSTTCSMSGCMLPGAASSSCARGRAFVHRRFWPAAGASKGAAWIGGGGGRGEVSIHPEARCPIVLTVALSWRRTQLRAGGRSVRVGVAGSPLELLANRPGYGRRAAHRPPPPQDGIEFRWCHQGAIRPRSSLAAAGNRGRLLAAAGQRHRSHAGSP